MAWRRASCSRIALQLAAQDGALELAEAVVAAEQVVGVPQAVRVAAAVAEGAHQRGGVRIVAQDHAALPGGQVLGGVKADDAALSEGAHPCALPRRAPGLRGVLHHGQPVLPAQRQQAVHVGRTAAEVNRHDGAGAAGQARRHAVGVEGVALRVDVGKNGDGAQLEGRGGGGDEGVARHDDLVPGPDPGGDERQLEGNRAVGDRHAVRGALEGSEFGLEVTHFLALQGVPTATLQDPLQRLHVALIPDRPRRKGRLPQRCPTRNSQVSHRAGAPCQS